MKKEFRGIFCALATPFTPNAESVDEAALRRLVDHMLANGIRGIITTGSTGECASMTMDERRTVLEVVLDQVRGRIPVLAHTAAVATREVVALSRHAQQAGADGLMVVGPYYEPINQDEIFAHYATIAKSVDLPIMVYNHPAATGYSMSPEFIAHLARDIDNVRLVKDTTGDVGRIHYLMELCGDSVTVFNGADTLAFAGFAAGTVGAVWGAANATPRQCVDLFDAIVEHNDLVRGREIWRPFYMVNRFFEQEGYVASVKAATTMQGVNVGDPRPPILPLPAQKVEALGKLLEACGLRGALPVGAR
jgi:4-hydroxy-tetrahydrodipicolinate synthase